MVGTRGTSFGVRVVAIALLISLSGCGFAVKHPAVTAGIVGGTVALGTCELASADQKACFAFSGGAALFLGLVVASAMWLGTYEEDEVPAQPQDDPATGSGTEPEPEPDRDLDPAPPPATTPPPAAPPPTVTPPPTPPTTTPAPPTP